MFHATTERIENEAYKSTMSINSSIAQQRLIMEEQQKSFNSIIDNTKDTIQRVTAEGLAQNSRSTNTIKEIQQTSIEIIESILYLSLEKQNGYIKAVEPAWNIENYTPKGLADTYSKTIMAYADDTVALYRLLNDVVVENVRTSLVSSIKQSAEHAKGLSEMGMEYAKNIQSMKLSGKF